MMRRKEGNVDYKFFPEPNIFPIRLDANWIKQIQDSMCELPDQRKARYAKEFGLNEHDISILIANKELGDYFEEIMKYSKNAKGVCNWLLGEVQGWLNKHEQSITNTELKPESLAKLVEMIDEKEISTKQAKELMDDIMTGKDPKESAKEKGLQQVTDTSALTTMIQEVLDENTQAIEDFKAGKDRAVGFLVGQVMKKSKGQANPGMVSKMLKEELQKRI